MRKRYQNLNNPELFVIVKIPNSKISQHCMFQFELNGKRVGTTFTRIQKGALMVMLEDYVEVETKRTDYY